MRRQEDGHERNREPIPIAGERGRGSRVEQRDGKILLILPRAGEPEYEDITFLRFLPGLLPMLADGIRRYSESGVSARTRRFWIGALRRYFVSYLAQGFSTPLEPIDLLDDALWAGFVSFLDQPIQANKPLELNTRAQALTAVRNVLGALNTSAAWADIADRVVECVPKNPWPGRSRKTRPVRVIPLDQFDAIVLAADKEFAELRKRREEGDRLLYEGRKRLAEGSRDFYQDEALCLASLKDRYPLALPSIDGVQADDRRLGRASKIHGIKRLARYLYPVARDLVPLVLLIAARTSYNPDTVLGLCWSDIQSSEMLGGGEALRVAPYKPRSAHEQVKTLDSEADASDGLRGLLDLVEAITAPLRPALPYEHRDRLFVSVPEKGSKQPSAFEERANPAGYGRWSWALNSFISDNNLPTFSLGQLRPTRGSEIFEATGDIMASREVLGHSSSRTTWTHYTSDGARRRQMERVGQIFLLRERWQSTGGRIDPRGDKPDPGAATPGFLCADPHDSPRPGQVKGRPCTAYGECAACPFAGVRNEVTAAAQYLGVREAILKGQKAMAPQTWLMKWAPILAEHNAMLSALDPDLVARASQIKLSYPAVG